MFRSIAFALVTIAFLPTSQAVAAAKKVSCVEQAQAACPGYGMSRQACVRAAIERCRKGK